MEQLKKITNMDKVTLALLLEEGKARISDIQFHVTLSKRQIRSALTTLVKQGMVIYEISTASYLLV
jgi:predicted DNA-binding transcriptional regulator